MPRRKRHVYVVDADGTVLDDMPAESSRSTASSSQSTTNPAPNYRPSQFGADNQAAPRSSSYHRPSAKGKGRASYARRAQASERSDERGDVSPGVEPSRARLGTSWSSHQERASGNPYMKDSASNYGHRPLDVHSFRPQPMYSVIPELVPYNGHNYYGPAGCHLPHYAAPPPTYEPPERPPAPPKSPSPMQKKNDEELESLRRELAQLRQHQREKEERQKQKEEEDRMRKDAEEAIARRIELVNLAREEAKKEIERARLEAATAAREAAEAQRKAEEQRRRIEEEVLEKCRVVAQEKLEAELRAEAESIRVQREKNDRLLREAEAKVEQEQKERQRLQKQEQEERERMRRQIREEVRAELRDRGRRYVSAASGTESFGSRSPQRSSDFSLWYAGQSESASSSSPKRARSRKTSSRRTTKAPSIISSERTKLMSSQMPKNEASTSSTETHSRTPVLNPFIYLQGQSTPPPKSEENDRLRRAFYPWETANERSAAWHFQPHHQNPGKERGFWYGDASGQTSAQGQPWPTQPDDTEGASSSSSAGSSNDHFSNRGITKMPLNGTPSGDESDTGTVIPASVLGKTNDVQRNSNGEADIGNLDTDNGSAALPDEPSGLTEHESRVGVRESQEDASSPISPFRYLITEDEPEEEPGAAEELEGGDDDLDGGADLADQNATRMTTAVEEHIEQEHCTGFRRPSSPRTSPARGRASGDSSLLLLLSKHISDFENEESQHDISDETRGKIRGPRVTTNNWSYFPPYSASNGSRSGWSDDGVSKMGFSACMGKHTHMTSARSSSSISSESEPEIPMALVPCIMVPLSMLPSFKQTPMF